MANQTSSGCDMGQISCPTHTPAVKGEIKKTFPRWATRGSEADAAELLKMLHGNPAVKHVAITGSSYNGYTIFWEE